MKEIKIVTKNLNLYYGEKQALKNIILRGLEMGFYQGVNFNACFCEDCGNDFNGKHGENCPKCNSDNIKIDFIYEKNYLSKIYFNNDISHESIGLTLSNIKEKINNNYFKLKKIRGK